MGVSSRHTASGVVHNERCNLFAITINKADAKASVIMLKDGLDEQGAILWEGCESSPGCTTKSFQPWLLFETGLYLDIVGDVYSVIIECL